MVVTLFSFHLLCLNRIKTVKRTQLLMGTYVEITVLGKNEKRINKAIIRAFQEMKKVENKLSKFIPGSEVSLINKNAGIAWVTVDPELIDIIQKAGEISEITGGSFDITVGILGEIWDFREGATVPDKKKIDMLLKLVDYRKVMVDEKNSRVFLAEKGMEIDLGGIAKGFIVDNGVRILEQNKIKNFIINAGGDLTVRGNKGFEPWKVGIQSPRDRTKIYITLGLTNKSITTSGDYEKYFMQDGVRYHHILNPGTGYPAMSCSSSSIVASDATTADTLSTAVFVLGPARGIKLIEALPEVQGMIVDKKGKAVFSSGFGDFILSRAPGLAEVYEK